MFSDVPAAKYNVDGWSGFCQMGWSTCSDAKANKDYNCYAKALGISWIQMMGRVDKEYCGLRSHQSLLPSSTILQHCRPRGRSGAARNTATLLRL
mmetsp:Transcript_13555/g.31025  ORF Transcript_13555/g.31025 Transcript_13555/m.31025 type:complete len:95 (+) Transcript_13555:298-582(+)